MNLKIRLAVMNFLEFAVWGAYLTCMGIYLSKVGMGNHIGSFFPKLQKDFKIYDGDVFSDVYNGDFYNDIPFEKYINNVYATARIPYFAEVCKLLAQLIVIYMFMTDGKKRSLKFSYN